MNVAEMDTVSDLAWAEREAASIGGSVVRWWTLLDNHEPNRAHAGGYGVRYTRQDGTPGFVFRPGAAVTGARRAVYVLDDGKTAVPYYVCGWQRDQGGVWVQPFPTNPDGKRRADNGEVIDYSGWALGPCRMYHLKISDL